MTSATAHSRTPCPASKKSFAEWVQEVVRTECPRDGLSLDIGCGWQRYREAYGNRVVGCDVRRDFRPAVAGSMEALPFPDASFDFVTSFQCLYYARDPAAAAREVVRVLKPGRTGLVSVSSAGHLYLERFRGRLAVPVRGHRWWGERFREAGCRVTSVCMPPRYHGWRAMTGRLQPALLSPYRFLRLQTAPGEGRRS